MGRRTHAALPLLALGVVSAAVPLACGSSSEGESSSSSGSSSPTSYVPGEAPSQNPLPPGATPRDGSAPVVDSGRDAGGSSSSSGGGDSGGPQDASGGG